MEKYAKSTITVGTMKAAGYRMKESTAKKSGRPCIVFKKGNIIIPIYQADTMEGEVSDSTVIHELIDENTNLPFVVYSNNSNQSYNDIDWDEAE